MKAILMSIQPKWVEKILNGEKTIEIRKTKPKLETPFKVYICCTKGKDLLRAINCYVVDKNKKFTNYKINNEDFCTNEIVNGKVIGEFICDKVEQFFTPIFIQHKLKEKYETKYHSLLKNSCLTTIVLDNYFKDKTLGYAYHITDLKIYDEPKEIYEFEKPKCDWKCNECKYCVSYSYYEPPDCLKEFCINRPPRSWQYVEELKE